MKRIAKESSIALALVVLLGPVFCSARADIFYAANNTNNTVDVFGPTGQLTNVLSSGLSGPAGMALFSNKLYVANSSNNTIRVFDLSSTQSTVFASTNLSQPTGLAFDKSGNLYAANWGNNTIVKFNPSGQGSIFASGSPLTRPAGIAIDASGNLYVANFGGGTIEKFNSNGVGVVFATGLQNPLGLAFDASGNLYVSNTGIPNGWVEKYATNGTGSVFVSGLDNPTGIGFDGVGNFYWLLPYGDAIFKLTTNRTESQFAYDPGLCSGVSLLIQSPLVIGCPTNPPCTNVLGQCTLGTNTVYGGNGTGVIPLGVDASVATHANFTPYTITRQNTMTGGNFQLLDFGGDQQNNTVNGCNCAVAVGQQFGTTPPGHVQTAFAERLASNPYVVLPIITNNQSARLATVNGFVWAKLVSLAGNGNWQLTLENVPSCGAQVPPADDNSVPVSGACGGVYTVTHDPDVITSQTCPNSYTVTRTYHATDSCGDSASISQIFTVNDTTTPWISCPNGITVNADPGKCTASNVNLGSPAAGTGCSGDVTLSSNAPSVYPKGTTFVIWTATAPCGNRVSCTQSVTVLDNQLPAIVCPAPLAVSCAAAVPSPNPASITASDNCGSVTVTFVSDTITNLICPDRYTVLRTYQATDSASNSVTCMQTITVNSTTPPGITAPSDVTVGTDSGQCYASGVALGSPATFSPCGGVLTITNTAPAAFAKGATQVIWTATDSCGNSASATQNVVVTDNQAPLVACPANILVNAQDSSGAIVAFSVTASDNCDSNLSVNCSPVPGSQFAVGTTPVNCVVVDSAGNTNSCSFGVTVVDPSIFNILSITPQSSDILLSWVMPLGLTGIVQGSADNDGDDFTNVSAPFFAPGNGVVTNSYLDAGGQTNFPQRFYRIRLTP